MFSKVMVANRGEIAIRVFRTLREMGIASVAVYSEVDRDALFVRHADEAYLLGPGLAAETYLNVPRILEIAAEAGVDAVHPGYGFLAENAGFARALADAGIVWIGPPADAIDAMGSKVRARALMDAAGVPIVPGVTEPVADVGAARPIAQEIGYPVAVKASSGGGGKGFRVALTPVDLEDAFAGAVREGERFFADGAVYLERYLPEPRHVEIQILADAQGSCVWLGERDCSIQRRHQKLVEETPSPVVSDDLRRRMGEASVRAAQAVSYTSAGTLEYLVSGEEFFFLEMNTRIQVEHTVTEAVTGLDLVREQMRVAAGEPLSISQAQVAPRGHAIECRINAEDASQRFLPSPARITALPRALGPGRAGRLGRARGSDHPRDLRPDGGQADRLGRGPRVGAAADDPGARRVRRGGAHHPHPVPPLAAGAGRVHRRRRLSRPAGPPRRGADADPGPARRGRDPRRRGAGRRAPDRAQLRRRGGRAALRGVAALCGPRRGLIVRSAGAQAQAGALLGGRWRRLTGPGDHADAGYGAPNRRRGRTGGRRGRDRLHRRGHEDGERGRGPPGRNRPGADGRRGTVGPGGRGAGGGALMDVMDGARRVGLKAQRAGQYVRAYSNWPEAMAMRALPAPAPDGIRIVRCRNGVRVAVRAKTSDMYIVSEGLAYGAYRALGPILRGGSGQRAVIDLGAHIGVFSLLAARSTHEVRAIAFEPGPDNARLLRRNVALNPVLAPRIEVHEAAAGRRAGTAHWQLDERDPSGSHLVDDGRGHEVRVVGLRDVLDAQPLPIACMKIDIEGSEYELLDGSEAADWREVPAVLVELHPDPSGHSSPAEWISRMRAFGYEERDRSIETVVLVRP